MQWEALESGNGAVTREAERQRAARWAVDEMRRRQAQGLLHPDLDPAQTLLSMVALTTFPVAFPQISRLLTGLHPTDPAFRTQRTTFLRRFARSLAPGLLTREPHAHHVAREEIPWPRRWKTDSRRCRRS